MSVIKFKRLLRIRHTTTNGGLIIIRRVLNDYAPLELLGKKYGKKLFGIPLLSVILAMVFRAVLGGGSFRDFEKDWNTDTTRGIFAGYRKKLTHALLARNLVRFQAETTRLIVMGMVKRLHSTGRVKLERVAIDSTKIIANGKKYQKSGVIMMKGKVHKGYKLHLVFDIVVKVPIAYMITPINVHDSKMLIHLVKMVERHYGKPPQEIVIDRGYYGVKFFQFLRKRKIRFIIPAKRFSAMKKALTQIKIGDFTPIKGGKLYYKDTELNIAKYGTIRCILVANKKFEDWMPEEAKEKLIWGLLTTHSTLSPIKIIHHYRTRWQIEVFFRSCRQQLGLNDLPGYDYRLINAHIGSVMLAYLSLAICALEDDDSLELTTIAITEWQNTFVKVSATCEIRGTRINYYFQEKSWLYIHLKTFCPEGGILI